jgi:hypothetical protein
VGVAEDGEPLGHDPESAPTDPLPVEARTRPRHPVEEVDSLSVAAGRQAG